MREPKITVDFARNTHIYLLLKIVKCHFVNKITKNSFVEAITSANASLFSPLRGLGGRMLM